MVAMSSIAPAQEAAPTADSPRERFERYSQMFDADRAHALTVEQVEIGPRHPGSPGAQQFVAWAHQQFSQIRVQAHEQHFRAVNALTGTEESGINIYAPIPAQAQHYIILSAHWDSRIYADMDPDPSRRRDPVPAANDSAASVGLLLEIARVVTAHGLPEGLGIMVVFYDFEDQGRPTRPDEFVLGSEYFARNLPEGYDVVGAINFTMIGDFDQVIPIERHSWRDARDLVNAFWSHGAALDPDRFVRRRQGFVVDDHVHLNRRGIPSIILLDFEYPEWHTVHDVPEKISPESLRIVGLATLSFLAWGGAILSP